MTTTHILNLLLAIGVVAALATVCRVAFVVAGQRAATSERLDDAEDRLAA